MKKLLLILMIGVFVLSMFGMVSAATTLFSDGFESGVFAPDWISFSGSPTIDGDFVSSGVLAAHLDGATSATDDFLSRNISTVGYEDIKVQYMRTASGIGGNDDFYAEYSLNGGASWVLLENLDMADSYALSSFTLPVSADNISTLALRFRVDDLDSATDDAAVDDVLVTGELISSPSPSCSIIVDDPLSATYYNDAIFTSWTPGVDCTSPLFDLYYREGNCSLTPGTSWTAIAQDVASTSYSWTSELTNGTYCFRVEENNNAASAATSGLFFIDNVDPIANLSSNAPYSCNEGSSVTLNASWSWDNNGIVSYEWDLDNDGFYDDASGVTTSFACVDGPSSPTVGVLVTDVAGNTDTESTTVSVNNLNPVCTSLTTGTGYWDGAVGFSADFVASATDVAGDLPLTYTWNWNDSSSNVNGGSVSHAYTVNKTYNVSVTVTDGDSGSCVMSGMFIVVDPTNLPNQEVVAFHNLDVDFGAWAGAGNSFMSGLSSLTECLPSIASPANMFIDESGNDCVVEWGDAGFGFGTRPNNSEQGVHHMAVRTSNSTDYKYYEFDTTVYSWIIGLQQGWNLISIPLVPENSDLEEVFGPARVNASAIWSYKYNPSTGMSVWECRKPTSTGSSWSSTNCTGGYPRLESMEAGRGYWIEMKNTSVIKGFGKKAGYSFPQAFPEVPAQYNHWSLFGRYGIANVPNEFGDIDKATALSSLAPLSSTVYKYDGIGSMLITSDFSPEDGYWVFASHPTLDDGTYTPVDSEYGLN